MLQTYRYWAKSRRGRLASGFIKAENQRAAQKTIEGRFQRIYLLQQHRRISGRDLFGPKMGISEKIIFVKNLQVTLKAGLTLDESLKIIEGQGASSAMRKVSHTLLKQVRAGNSFSDALSRFGKIFDPFFINLIYIGERSGTLDGSLEHLSKELEHTLELRRKIRGASFYPIIVLFAVAVLGTLMVTFVLPQMTNIFRSIDIELPTVTRALLDVADFLRDESVTTLAAIALAFILFRLLLRLPPLRIIWIRFLLHIPVIGSLVRSYNLAQAFRTLGVLLTTGTPLLDALEITAHSTNNLLYKIDLSRARLRVAQGMSLGESLSPDQFTPLVTQLIASGEKSGSLETNLFYIADFFNARIDYLTKNLPTFIEPLLLIGVGLAVAFVAFATLSPIYEFTASVGR